MTYERDNLDGAVGSGMSGSCWRVDTIANALQATAPGGQLDPIT